MYIVLPSNFRGIVGDVLILGMGLQRTKLQLSVNLVNSAADIKQMKDLLSISRFFMSIFNIELSHKCSIGCRSPPF